jgi:hypothetical protein
MAQRSCFIAPDIGSPPSAVPMILVTVHGVSRFGMN